MRPLINKKYIIDCLDHQGEALCIHDSILDNETKLPTYFAFSFENENKETLRTVITENEIIEEILETESTPSS